MKRGETKPKTGETKAKRAPKADKPKVDKPKVEPVPLPATWRALRLAFDRKTRAAVARVFAAGGVTLEDVLALELAVVRGLLADGVGAHARYLSPHLRHIAALQAAIRDEAEEQAATAARKALGASDYRW